MNFYAKLALCQSKRNLTEFPAADAANAVCVCFASTHVSHGTAGRVKGGGVGAAAGRTAVAPLGKDFAWLPKGSVVAVLCERSRTLLILHVRQRLRYIEYILPHTQTRNSVGICVCAWALLNVVRRLSKIAANERWYTICSGRRQQYN